MLLEIAATYFAKLPVTDQTPTPVGSHTMPMRGLRAASFVTSLPVWSRPWFLSHRIPRFADRRAPSRQLSLKNNEWVRKFDPTLGDGIGLYWMMVELSLPRNFGITSFPTM